MDLLKPKFNYGDEVYRIKYNKRKGEIEDCNKCNGTGQLKIHYETSIYCSACNGIGKYRTEFKVYSIDEDAYFITGIRLNEDSIEYCLSEIIQDEFFNDECVEMFTQISEDTLFLNKEEAEKECDIRNLK